MWTRLLRVCYDDVKRIPFQSPGLLRKQGHGPFINGSRHCFALNLRGMGYHGKAGCCWGVMSMTCGHVMLWESVCLCWCPEDGAVVTEPVLPGGSIADECQWLLLQQEIVGGESREEKQKGAGNFKPGHSCPSVTECHVFHLGQQTSAKIAYIFTQSATIYSGSTMCPASLVYFLFSRHYSSE